MKKIMTAAFATAMMIGTGCFSGRVNVKNPDGTEVSAKISALAHDANLDGFEWISSNTTVRVNRYITSGGNSNLTVVCAAAIAWANAIQAAAAAAK